MVVDTGYHSDYVPPKWAQENHFSEVLILLREFACEEEGEAFPESHRAHLMVGFKPQQVALSRTLGHSEFDRSTTIVES